MICPALRIADGGGLADALAAVDCRTGEATAGAFARLFGADGALLPALTILLTLYVALFAIGLITGRTRLGAAALTPRMLTLGLALTFATSWVAYHDVVWTLLTGAPDQVASLLAGTHGSATSALAHQLDRLFAAISEAAAQARAAAPPPPPAGLVQAAPVASAQATPGVAAPSNLLWISGLMLLVGTVGVLVTARIALAVLLAVGPVFIVLALFRGTRGLFEGWLKAAVLFALVPMFAVLIGGGTLALIAPMVRAALVESGDTGNQAAVALFLAACVYLALMLVSVKAAATIVGGWRLPGGGTGDVSARDAAAVGAAAAATIVSGGAAPAPRAAPLADERVRAIVSALPAPANDGGGLRAGTTDRTVRFVSTPAPSAAATPATAARRIDGVGSRFRAPSPTPTARDRLS